MRRILTYPMDALSDGRLRPVAMVHAADLRADGAACR